MREKRLDDHIDPRRDAMLLRARKTPPPPRPSMRALGGESYGSSPGA
jgi:hypothetical protein